ncbi:hypothetical protein ACGGZK_12305 [Agromyces sp. MMS24-K17]|uniref:hypothetical protein n=1 Tax=Agromyces sp. MMS24-K17 TaxID=3372850 RepID=UPI00375513EA
MVLSPGRIVGIAVGTLAILGIGVYGPAMLLGPLPAAAVTPAAAATTAPAPAEIPLPAVGQSALAVLDEAGEPSTIATAGDGSAVPIGGAAKLVTVLTVLDSLPLVADQAGPDIPIGPADYTDYLRYRDEGSRVLQVSPGEKWSERDVVRAALLASSNNHADTLARWAFGGVEPYVAAANGWLAEQGFTATRVADATGLSGDNVGNAEELSRLVALAMQDPELVAILDEAGSTAVGQRSIPDVVGHLADRGIRTLTRSYTDQAALTYAFTTTLPSDGGTPVRLVGAMLLIPDYDTLDPAVRTAVDGVTAAAAPVDLITEGSVYATVRTAWGDQADLVATATRQGAGWSGATGTPDVSVDEIRTSPAGREVGRVTIPTGSGEVASPLEVSSDLNDPGPIWRLTNPFAIIGAFTADQERAAEG